MKVSSINLLEEINKLSKVHHLDRADINGLMYEFAKRIAPGMHIEKISVWLLNERQDKLIAIGEYDSRDGSYKTGSIIAKNESPEYFKSILENKILLVENVLTNPATQELSESYLIPNNIISLMDIPMRIDGELIGVICFEKTGNEERVFSGEDQFFGLSLSLVFASTMEARYRRALQFQLDKELLEKEILIKEIHHRVKNNLSVVSGLLRLQSEKAQDEFHRDLLNECQLKINSIAHIHNIIYQNKPFSKINVQDYFQNLLAYMNQFFKTELKVIDISSEKVQAFELSLEIIMPLALIVNEVITNCFKHAFVGREKGQINIELYQESDVVFLRISDDGHGFDCSKEYDSLGMEIIKGLSDQLDATFDYCGKKGAKFELKFSIKK